MLLRQSYCRQLSRWKCVCLPLGVQQQFVCWITQLVVHRDYRKCRLAVGLLNELRKMALYHALIPAFLADHTESSEALASVRETMDWPFGELLDGHEFLLILQVRRRTQSRSAS
jgi:hypothetical protein